MGNLASNLICPVKTEPIGILVIDEQSRMVLETNFKALELLGAARERVIGGSCDACLATTAGEPPHGHDLYHSLAGDEISIRRVDGTLLPVELAVIRIAVGDRPCLVASFIESAAPEVDETAQRDSELLLSVISNVARNATFMLNGHGKIIYCNRAAELTFGWPVSEMLGQDLHLLLVPDEYLPAYWANVGEFRMSGTGNVVGKTIELTAKRRDGSVFPVEVSVSSVRHKGEWHAVGIVRDITERKQAELALRESEEKYRQIIDNVGIGISLISPQMVVMELNKQMREWFPEVKVADRPVCYRTFNTPPADGVCADCPVCRTFADGLVHEVTRVLPRGDTSKTYRIISSPIHNDAGQVVAAIEIVEDTTEQLRLSRELHQAQKLESVGRLAAGIAHEINTPIQYVGDNIEFMRVASQGLFDVAQQLRRIVDQESRNLPADLVRTSRDLLDKTNVDFFADQVPKAIDQSMEGVGRVSAIVQAMKEFSHPGSAEKTPVDINRSIQSTVTVSRNEWKYVADLECHLDPNLPPVMCLPGELNQVILNMIVNAAHAIGDVVGTSGAAKGLIKIITFREGQSVVIMLRDTGTGIPDEIKERVFDPFFTTKAVGRGTGQGLAIARDVIVEKHGGSIVVDSELGKGTTFIMHIPIGM